MWHKAIGPATALRVQAGDKVELDAWVRYKTKPTYHRHMTPLLMGQLLSGTYAGLGVFEGYTASQAAPLFEALAAAMQGTGEEDDRPFAYLNFALFAHDMSLLDAGWERIPEEAGFGTGEESLPNRHKRVAFTTPVVVPEDGFIYIWLSNESEGTEVWFDDLHIRHTQTLVAQATDFGVWGEVLREQRSDARKYRYGYQGQYAEKDEETGWNHFELRQYDAVIGRWLSVDPYRQYHSPYVGMGNNPVGSSDPDGGKDIVINGSNNSSITIKTFLKWNFSVNFDFHGDRTYDASNIFIGFNSGGSGTLNSFVGFDGSASLIEGFFLGGPFAYYPYYFVSGEIGVTAGTPDASISVFKNLVIGFYGKDPSFITPMTLEGTSEYYGGAVTLGPSLITVGLNGQYTEAGDWKLYELGPIVSFGPGTPVSVIGRSNVPADRAFSPHEPTNGTKTILLNSNFVPTLERSWIDRVGSWGIFLFRNLTP
jgi:RHS repeat-associated protein